MKKVLSLILASVMLLSAVACTRTDATKTAGATKTATADDLYADEEGVRKICVSVNGDDVTADGTKAHPYATVDAARLAVREIDRTGLKRIDVIIGAGTYFVDKTIAFWYDDAGDENCTVRYIGEDGATLTGGIEFTSADFAPVNDTFAAYLKDDAKAHVVEIDLTKYGITADDVAYGTFTPWTDRGMNSLFQGSTRLQVARYPNDGLCTISSAKVRDDGDYTFNVSKEDYAVTKTWHDKENVYVQGYFAYYWANDNSKILSFSSSRNSFTVKYNDHYEPAQGMVFIYLNVAEELDAPGEYFIDTDGMLYYYPLDNFENETLTYPISSEKIMSVVGNNYVFENITFENTLTSALDVWGDNNAVIGCTVRNTGDYGMLMSGYGNLLDSCEISSTCKHGVSFFGGDTTTLTKANSVATNNYIHNFGQDWSTYNGAFNIGGCGLTISHNEIAYGRHLALSYTGNYNVIEYNYFHNLCQYTDDAGVIYCGRTYSCYGNVMRYNHFKDIGSVDSTIAANGGSGIYWDDGLGGQTAYGNVFENVKGSAYAIGGGPDHTVENNLFINCRTAISYDQRMWDGIFAGGWCKHNMGSSISGINYTSGVWAEAFPTLAKMNYDDATGGIDDPWFYVEPARSSVKGNYAFKSDRDTSDDARQYKQFNIEERVYLYSTVENCEEFTYPEGSQITVEEALAMLGDKIDIPYSEMGRLNVTSKG